MMKKVFKTAVLFLAFYVIFAQAVNFNSGMRAHSNNIRTEVAGGIDILSPDPICVVRNNA